MKKLKLAKHVLAVSSAKGGVGKSTVAAKLAVAFNRHHDLRVGLLDCDVQGPSVPRLMGMHDVRADTSDDGKKLLPVLALNVATFSMGYLVDEDAAMIWRGPMVGSAVGQLLNDVEWPEKLDMMVIDLPPGTSDAQISIAQRANLTAALLVTTPHPLAMQDTWRGSTMFSKINVPMLGIVENMSYFECPKCGERSSVFGGHGSVALEGQRKSVECLAELPLNPQLASPETIDPQFEDLTTVILNKIREI